jgi:hypothetical protein
MFLGILSHVEGWIMTLGKLLEQTAWERLEKITYKVNISFGCLHGATKLSITILSRITLSLMTTSHNDTQHYKTRHNYTYHYDT